jgi:hypothetical protein
MVIRVFKVIQSGLSGSGTQMARLSYNQMKYSIHLGQHEPGLLEFLRLVRNDGHFTYALQLVLGLR